MTSFRLLGAVEAVRDGRPLELGGPKQRAVLAILLLNAGRVVPADRIMDAVWGDSHPPSVAASLQAFVSNLRRVLRDDERATSPIVRKASGYLIDVPPIEVDVTRLVAAAEAAQTAVEARDWAAAVIAAGQGETLWRGPLLDEWADQEWVRVPATALTERRMACAEHLIVGLLGVGRVAAAVSRSGELVAEDPLRERACWLHMVALYRSGRTPDALEAYRRYREQMDGELGLDVGPALRDLQGAILRQDAELAGWPGRGPTTAVTPGVVEPVAVAGPASSGERSGDLVGRDRELSAIDSALSEVRPDEMRWLALTGAAGIGKSRLAEEAAGHWLRDGGRVLRAGCPDDEGIPAWWPIRQLLRELVADPDVVLTPPEGIDADAARFAAYERVVQTIMAAARADRLMLVVEDVHWADAASMRFLCHLAEADPLPGVVVVVTVRDETSHAGVQRLLAAAARRPGSRQLALPPLTGPEVAALAAQISGQLIAPEQAAELAERTGGNAFFVCEYARLPEAERLSGDVPVAVRSVLGRRLAGLDPAVLQVLRTAAIIGDTLDVNLLSRVTRLDRDELADLLDEAADEAVIVPAQGTGGYRFTHALLRDEITRSLSALRRQRLHLRVAEAIGLGGDGDQLARRASHLVAAGPLADSTEVFDACRAAASAAEARWQSEDAALWWGHALQTYDTQPPAIDIDRDEVMIAQVAALARSGRGQSVLDVIDAGLIDALRGGRLDSVGRLAATLLRSSGSWPWAVYGDDPAPLLARLAGLETAVRANPGAHARVLAALAVGSCYDPDGAVPDLLSRRAIEVAERTGDPDVLADALLGRAMTFSGLAERAEESIALVGRMIAVPHRTQELDEEIAHGLLYLAHMALGNPEASEQVRLGTLGSDVMRLPTSRVQFRWADASLSLWRGENLAETEQRLAVAFELHQGIELYQSGVYDVALMCLRWEQGRLHELEAKKSANARVVSWAPAVIAAARNAPDAPQLIAAELERVEPASWTTHGRLTMLAHAVADLRLVEHAESLTERLHPLARCIANIGQVGVVGSVALALARLRVVVGDLDGARDYLSTAAAVAERSGGVGATLRCRLLELQLTSLQGRPVDRAAARDVANRARRRGHLSVEREALQLVAGALATG